MLDSDPETEPVSLAPLVLLPCCPNKVAAKKGLARLCFRTGAGQQSVSQGWSSSSSAVRLDAVSFVRQRDTKSCIACKDSRSRHHI